MLNHTIVSIVDDNQPFRESLRKLVMLFGYTVESFPSAADFLASRLVPETDCLVADVHMPGMTGVELHGHLVDTGHAIPTILVTAYPDEVVRDQALKDGVVCYLSKPVDDDDLERCLRSALQPVHRFEGNSRVLLGRGQGELKYGPPRLIGTHPQPASMTIDDGLANRKPHPNSAGLGGVEGFENSLKVYRINAGP
jgi:DNA-binding NtrC family response regulator